MPSCLPRPVLAAVAALALAAAGCSAKPWTNPPADLLDRPWQNVPPAPDPAPDADATLVAGLDAALVRGVPPPVVDARPVNVLVLSGGGKFGAYTAGILTGWTDAGTRPAFDAVTGISSGALCAIYAYLGPKYDRRMESSYVSVHKTDLFKLRPVRGLLRDGTLATSQPLADRIAQELDAETMADLRAAHAAGRRLYVATVNTTTLRPAVWDLGAVACSGRPDADQLVCKILLAACSIPGFVPPVEFRVTVNGVEYKELHGDAGCIIQAFVRAPDGLPPGSNVYVVTAGKVYRDVLNEKPGLLRMIGATVSNSLYALYRDDLIKVYAACAATGSKFHVVALPQDFPGTVGSLTFEPGEQRRLFDAGRRSSAAGVPWRFTPPGTAPDEALVPRTGLDFLVPAAGP